jgi:serine/threonine-protein kinase
MDERPDLMAVARAISERAAVDWNQVESSADADERVTLREFRVIAEIAALHRGGALAPAADAWGPFRLLEHIGHGSFGDVYRALDTRLEREVALKLMRRPDLPGDLLGTAVIDEARLLARVRHPNVVTIHGADRIDGRLGLWMEFVRGRTLEQVVQDRGPLPAAEVAAIGVEICQALGAVHDAGLLHRDIKAQNVMQEPGGRLVLMDFGAGREGADGDAEALAGTPLYLAPEVLDGQPTSVQSDVYSVGVLLHHLSTGGYPVVGRTVREVRDAHHAGGPRALDAPMSPALAVVVRRALDPIPGKRYGSAADMATALHAAFISRVRRWQEPAVAATLIVAAATVLAWRYASWPAGLEPRKICQGCGDEGASFDPTGRWMVFTDRSRGNAAFGVALRDMTLDATTPQDTWLISAPPDSFYPAISSDAQRVAYTQRTNGLARLHVVSAAPGRRSVVILDSDRIAAVTPAGWSADGQSVLVVIERQDASHEIAWVATADGSIRPLVHLGWRLRGVNGRPTLSPDGQYVAYSALAVDPGSADAQIEAEDQQVFVTRADGSGRETAVVPRHDINESPVWTPDGSGIVFVSNWSGTFDLRIVPIRNGEAVGATSLVWKDLGCRCISPHVISPAGLLYYTRKPPPEERTVIVEMETPGTRIKGPSVIVSDILAGSLPSWSPNGQAIATKALRAGGSIEVFSRDYVTILHSLRPGEPRRYLWDGARRTQVRWLRDGSGLLETVQNAEGSESLYRVDPVSGQSQRLMDYDASIYTRTMALFSQVSDDGATLYVFRYDADKAVRRLAAIDLNSGLTKLQITIPIEGFSLKLSPDGRTLAITGTNGSTTHLSVVDVSNNRFGTVRELHALNNSKVSQIRPMLAWTADSRGILFVQEEALSRPLPTPRRAVVGRNPGSWNLDVVNRKRIMHRLVDGNTPPTFTGVDIVNGALQEISLNDDGSRLAYGLGTGARELWQLDVSSALRALSK